MRFLLFFLFISSFIFAIDFDALESIKNEKTNSTSSLTNFDTSRAQKVTSQERSKETWLQKKTEKFVEDVGKYARNETDMKKVCLAQTEYGSSYCHGIKNNDMKRSCLAQTEYGSSHCHGIKNNDMKRSCLAQTEYGSSHCHGIKNNDMKRSCLAQTEYGSSHCYGIKNNDMKQSCLAQTKHKSSYCHSIK